LGITLQKLERLDEAAACCRQAIALKPDFAEAHSNLGITLKNLGRLEEALASYRQAIALKPDFAEAHYNVGLILHMEGHVEAGIENLAKADDIDSNLSGSNLVLSVLRARQARERTEESIDRTDLHRELGSKLIYLERSVEAELIVALYEMQSREMDEARNTPVFGNGRCSINYNMLDEDLPIIKIVEGDLIGILKRTFKSEIYLQDSFFNIYGAGAGIPPHNHLNELDEDKYLDLAKQKYSLVYYISVGDQECHEPGILKLHYPEEEILPCDGMIVIMPAGRSHSTIYGGKTDRIMIGVNFYVL
jgi:tetratricopeptide (TPR) repeat protein